MSRWGNKVVLVTGGSAGLGLAIARDFAVAGAHVFVAARDPVRLSEAVQRIGESESIHAAVAIPVDVTDDTQVNQMVSQAVALKGRLDVLVNFAGRSMRGRSLDTGPEAFSELIELNFLAVVRCVRMAAGELIRSGGHVVNIGSLASKSAGLFLGAYPASKAPLAVYSQQLRLEIPEVHTLLVCPGPLARADRGRRYDDQSADLPDAARDPGGGIRLKGIDPDKLARRIRRACERRQAELVVPGRAKLLFAVSQLWPSLGDRIIRGMTK